MANVRVTGTQEFVEAFKGLQFKFKEKALREAARAGADIAKRAIEQSNIPVGKYPKGRKRDVGPIKKNIIIQTRRREQEEKGEQIFMMIGPSKKAFYEYFLEKGWYPAGRRVTWFAAKGRWLPAWKSGRRRLRIAGQETGHSQMGSLPSRFILGKKYIENIYNGIAPEITRAMKAAFERIVSK